MSDISKIRLENEDYNIKDETAREDILELQNRTNKICKFYNDVSEMKNDLTLSNNDIVYCLGYQNKGDIGKGIYYITNEELIEDNITIIKLENDLFARLCYDNKIYIEDVSLLTTNIITSLINNNITIITNDLIPITDTINITSNNLLIKNMKFIGNDDTKTKYCLNLLGNNIIVQNCYFSGKIGNYIRNNGNNNKIINNSFDGSNYETISPVVTLTGENTIISNNTFINNSGFNIQTLFTKNVNISNNMFLNPHLDYEYTAIGGETSINFEVDFNPVRKATKINTSYNNNVSYSYDEDNKILTIDFHSTLSANDKVYFRGYKSLECININSNSYDITITGNIIKGSGDSGIVLGSDYHNGVLDPSNTTSIDYPKRINVSNNAINDCSYSGVCLTAPVQNVTISNNVISNCGWLTNGIFSSGIYIPQSSKHASICNNVITNVIVNEGRLEQETGIMKYGILVNPMSLINNTDTTDYLNINNKLIIKNNTINNVEYRIRFYPSSNFAIQLGTDFDSSKELIFDEINGITTPTGIFYLGGSATCQLDTDEIMDGNNSMKVTFSNSSQYFDFQNNALKSIRNSKVKVTFFAKASDNDKVMQIYYNTPTVIKQNRVWLPLTTDWNYYEMEMFIGDLPSFLTLRASSASNTGNIWLSHIRFSIQSFD